MATRGKKKAVVLWVNDEEYLDELSAFKQRERDADSERERRFEEANPEEVAKWLDERKKQQQ